MLHIVAPEIARQGSVDDFLDQFLDAISAKVCDVESLMVLAATAMGARSASLYVTDYGMMWLQRVGVSGPDGAALPIPGTSAGRTYVEQIPVVDPANPGCIWMPLTDGAERLGVVEVVGLDQPETSRLRRVVLIVALALNSHRRYTDLIERCRRVRPLSPTAEVQWALLPPVSCETDQISVSGILEPAYDAGGDSFDYAFNHNIVHVTVIDAVGHDMAAMLLSGAAINTLRNARREGRSLTEAYLETGAVIASEFGECNFVTGQIAMIDVLTGTMSWINAGHPLPILVRNGVTTEMCCAVSPPMGLGGAVVEVAADQLLPGDRILFHTDGVAESRSTDGVVFGDDMLRQQLVATASSNLSAAQTVRQLASQVVDHVNGPLTDDASLMLVEYKGPLAPR